VEQFKLYLKKTNQDLSVKYAAHKGKQRKDRWNTLPHIDAAITQRFA
jgi:hypothetical protein